MEQPNWTIRSITVAAVLLTLAAGITIALIALGAFDPRPVGPQTAVDSLSPLPVAAGESAWVWQERPLPAGDFSIRLTAALASGETDCVYGVALGSGAEGVIAAVSPLGYVTLQRQTGDDDPTVLLPLQPWPHVRGGTAVNELWLDVIGDQLTVRVNQELLWSGSIALPGRRVGLFAHSYGETAVIDFRTLRVYAAK